MRVRSVDVIDSDVESVNDFYRKLIAVIPADIPETVDEKSFSGKTILDIVNAVIAKNENEIDEKDPVWQVWMNNISECVGFGEDVLYFDSEGIGKSTFIKTNRKRYDLAVVLAYLAFSSIVDLKKGRHSEIFSSDGDEATLNTIAVNLIAGDKDGLKEVLTSYAEKELDLSEFQTRPWMEKLASVAVKEFSKMK